MPETRDDAVAKVDLARAADLCQLVELEARWENLRKAPRRGPESEFSLADLVARQKAYEAFRSRLEAYNRRYKPGHRPEALLNTPSRLGLWCRAMRDLYGRVQDDPRHPCPVHVLEKAYRWAERVAARKNEGHARRPPPGTTRAAVEDLDALAAWCDALATSSSGPGLSTLASGES